MGTSSDPFLRSFCPSSLILIGRVARFRGYFLHFRKEFHHFTHGSGFLALPCSYFNIQCVFHRVRSQSILSSHMAVSFSRDVFSGNYSWGLLFPAVCVASFVLKKLLPFTKVSFIIFVRVRFNQTGKYLKEVSGRTPVCTSCLFPLPNNWVVLRSDSKYKQFAQG